MGRKASSAREAVVPGVVRVACNGRVAHIRKLAFVIARAEVEQLSWYGVAEYKVDVDETTRCGCGVSG